VQTRQRRGCDAAVFAAGARHRGDLRVVASLGAAQADNPPDAGDMIMSEAPPLDSDVDWVGDGPVPPEPVGN
jgi:hypothetical protein